MTPEFAFLCQCLINDSDLAPPENLDWTRFTDLAVRHKVAPLVYNAMRTRAWQRHAPTPAPADNILHNHATQAAARSLAYMTALTQIRESFARANLPVMTFKGIALAHTYYGDIGKRDYLDLDLLVHTDDVPRALELLKELGYQRDTFPGETGDPERDYHAHFVHPTSFLAVELHWALAFRYFSSLAGADLFWENAVTRAIGGVEVMTPDDEAMLVYLCSHGYRHNWSRLSWICDVAQLLRACPDLDWAKVNQLASQARAKNLLLLGLALAADLLHAPIPDTYKAVASEPRIAQAVQKVKDWLESPDAPPDLAIQQFHLLLREDLRDRVAYLPYAANHFLRTKLKPNERDRAFVKLPKRLEFLYYVVRPVRLLRDYLLK
jgi:hypothetical protein